MADLNRKARRQRLPKVDTNAVLKEFRESDFPHLVGKIYYEFIKAMLTIIYAGSPGTIDLANLFQQVYV
jgi:hypothetical protein